MEPEELISLLIVGVVAGWLAGLLLKGRSFGLIGNMVVGVVGAFVGQFLARTFEFSIGGGKWVSPILTATIGAVVLVFVISVVNRKR